MFHSSLFVKSTEPTSIFKLGVKKTGQCAPAINIGKEMSLPVTLMPDMCNYEHIPLSHLWNVDIKIETTQRQQERYPNSCPQNVYSLSWARPAPSRTPLNLNSIEQHDEFYMSHWFMFMFMFM